MDKRNFLKEQMNAINMMLTEEQIDQFIKYYDYLIKKNEVMNLTAITEYKEVVIKHFVDSISLVKTVDINNINSLIDLGTGAGFPGIPLKIIFPHLKITLLDSLNKRIKFLDEVIELLDLEDIAAIHGRAEDIGKNNGYREQYDVCVSRAVANLSTLSEYCLPLVKIGGYFIPYKAQLVDKEVEESNQAIQMLGGELEKVNKFVLPDSDFERSHILIKKVEKTASKYPRKAGKPAKEPLS